MDPATQTVDYGSEATVVINPDAGYGVASITDNEVPMPIAIPYVIGDVAEDHDVVVTFKEYSFYFAEGYTGTDTFNEYLCLMNPGDDAVSATYHLHVRRRHHPGAGRAGGRHLSRHRQRQQRGRRGQRRLGEDRLGWPHRGRAADVLQLQRRLDRWA